jgi:O-antigen/teichoic acid export membrane protein
MNGVALTERVARRHGLPGTRTMLANVASLAGATAITLPLGFAFWSLAAHLYPAHSVGLASAAVSAMTLLSTVCSLGLGTLLIGELPRRRGDGSTLLTTALLVVALAGAALGLAFAVVAGTVSEHLDLLASPVTPMLFALGVALTTLTIVLDQALVGVLRGGVQFWRNATLGLSKLILLGLISGAFAWQTGTPILAAWVAGLVLSVGAVVAVFLHEGHRVRNWRPDWSLVRALRRAAGLHHALNLTLTAPLYTLPVIATTLITPQQGAYFYAAWMVGGVVTIIPLAFATVLFAITAAELEMLRARVRQALAYSLTIAITLAVVLLVAGPLVLRLFGADYADNAGTAVRLVALGGVPLVLKYHFVAVSRALNHLGRAVVLVAIGSGVEILAAAAGARLGGIDALAGTWTLVVYVEGAVLGAVLYRVAIR